RELGLLPIETAADRGIVTRLGALAAGRPRLAADPVGHSVWIRDRKKIRELLDAGNAFADHRSKLSTVLSAAAWREDLSRVRRALARRGDSIFRWFYSDYRMAVREMKSVCTGELPRGAADRIAILDALAEAKSAREQLERYSEVGHAAFGSFWQAEESEWPHLDAIYDWASSCDDLDSEGRLRSSLARHPHPEQIAQMARRLEELLAAHFDNLRNILTEKLELDLLRAFDVDDLLDIRFTDLLDRVHAWCAEPARLDEWVRFRKGDVQLRRYGLAALADKLASGEIPPHQGIDVFNYAYNEALIRKAWAGQRDLSTFEGGRHNKLVRRFRSLDLERIRLARAEVAAAHHRRIPRGITDSGQIGVLVR
ncbi:MAG: hypothetical protein D6773_04375, partial [Alphaproteobacteria bacterium]